MVLTNSGGPGGLGINYIELVGDIIANITGPGYDIIGFDPRGMGYSIPNAASGYGNQSYWPERRNASYIQPDKILARDIREDHYGIEIPPRHKDWEASVYLMGDEMNLLFRNISGENQALRYMGTPNVAYDMLQIAKADARSRGLCEEDVLVHYYGVSYGTALGQTFAALYPNHVGRMVIDSCVNITDWYSGNMLETTMQEADEGFATFFPTCYNGGPERCAFHTEPDADAVRLRFNSLMNSLDPQVALDRGWENATALVVGFDMLKSYMTTAGNNAIANFPALAELLVIVESLAVVGNITMENISLLLNEIAPNSGEVGVQERPENIFQTWCTDSIASPFVGSKEPLDPVLVETARNYSVVTGERFVLLYGVCTRLDLTPNWRWNGPFGGKTKTPILFIGLSHDPITPLINAQTAAEIHEDAEYLRVDGVAHTILMVQNWCAFEKTRAYFQEGKMPGEDNHCEEAVVPFTTDVGGEMRKRSLGMERHVLNPRWGMKGGAYF